MYRKSNYVFCPVTVGSVGICKRQECCLSFRNTALRSNKADIQHVELAELRSDVFVSNSFNWYVFVKESVHTNPLTHIYMFPAGQYTLKLINFEYHFPGPNWRRIGRTPCTWCLLPGVFLNLDFLYLLHWYHTQEQIGYGTTSMVDTFITSTRLSVCQSMMKASKQHQPSQWMNQWEN